MKWTCNVTQELINDGMREKPSSCPIALTFYDFPNINLSSISVGELRDENLISMVQFETLDHIKYRCSLPVDADSFIADFDEGNDVSPMCFEIELIKKEDYDG